MNAQIEKTKNQLRELGWTDCLDEAAKQIEVTENDTEAQIMKKVKDFDEEWKSLQD